MVSYALTTHAELAVFVAELIRTLRSTTTSTAATILALHGDLGAGKTTLVQQLALQLGTLDTVTSPTFVIMKQYETTDATFPQLVHIDAYRIETVDEMRPLGFGDILKQPQTLICVEWAERIKELLPAATIHLTLTHNADDTRTITYGD